MGDFCIFWFLLWDWFSFWVLKEDLISLRIDSSCWRSLLIILRIASSLISTLPLSDSWIFFQFFFWSSFPLVWVCSLGVSFFSFWTSLRIFYPLRRESMICLLSDLDSRMFNFVSHFLRFAESSIFKFKFFKFLV